MIRPASCSMFPFAFSDRNFLFCEVHRCAIASQETDPFIDKLHPTELLSR